MDFHDSIMTMNEAIRGRKSKIGRPRKADPYDQRVVTYVDQDTKEWLADKAERLGLPESIVVRQELRKVKEAEYASA